jgi:hypothetical protein
MATAFRAVESRHHTNMNNSRVTEHSREDVRERRATPQARQRSSSHNKINTSTSSVFERLYNSSLMIDDGSKTKTDRQVKDREKSKENKNPNYQSLVNNGVMIYERNTRLTEENKRKIQRRIEELRIQQESELTFKPEINPISKLMVERVRELSTDETIQ